MWSRIIARVVVCPAVLQQIRLSPSSKCYCNSLYLYVIVVLSCCTVNCRYVPFYARDETTFVDAEALKQWLIFAILEEDPFVPPILDQIERQKNKIKDVDKRLKNVVRQEFLEPDGKEMLPEKAEREREALFKAIGEERDRLDAELKRREALLVTHREWRSSKYKVTNVEFSAVYEL